MDEPKGGPVKPPTLDLKPTKSSRVKPGGARAGGAKQIKATPKAEQSVQATPHTGVGDSQSGQTGRKPTSAAKPEMRASSTASSATSLDSTSNVKPTKTQGATPISEKVSSHARAHVSSSPFDDVETRGAKSPSNYLIVIAGAIGGALLALLIIIPVLLTGALQPGDQQQQDQIDDLGMRVGLSEEQTREGLVGYNALNGRVSSLRDQFTGEIERLGTIQSNLEEQQSDLAQKGNAIIARQDDLLANIQALQSVSPVEFDPSALNEEIHMLNQRFDAIDAGASSSDAERFATDLAQIHSEISALEDKISTQIEGDLALKIQDLIGERTENLQADILAHTGQIEANQSQLNDVATHLIDNSAALAELDTRFQAPSLQGGAIPSDNSSPVVTPGLAFALERAVATGESFDQLLEIYLLNVPDIGVSEALMLRAPVGLDTQQELIEAFNTALPKMLAARPGAPDANWLERFGNSLKSLFAIRTTGERDGHPVDNSLNQLQDALSEGHYEDAWYWLGQLPEPMQAELGDVEVQILLLREIEILLEDAPLPEDAIDNAFAPVELAPAELVPLDGRVSDETLSPESANSGGTQ